MSTNKGNEDLIADYLGEAHDYLEHLNQILLDLAEAGSDWPAERVNELFRHAHSLKGLSACFGFESTNKVTHQLENLLSLIRDGRLSPQAAVVRTMFAAIDLVTHLTAEIASSGHEHAPIDLVVESLDKIARDPARFSVPPEDVDGEACERVGSGGSAAKSGGPKAAGKAASENETVRVRMERLDKLVNLTGELVITRSRFQLVARQLRALQRLGELNNGSQELLRGLAELRDQLLASDVDDAIKDRVERIWEQAERLAAGHTEVAPAQRCVKDLDDAAYDLDGVVGGIHEAVLQVRMVPLDSVFRRLQRVVRDTADALDKQVDLDISGGETLIDKRVADELVNPLVHILRNAVDHGLEKADGRRAAGKPPRGKVTVDSYQRGSSVVIEVRDDGRGIDPQKILAKAVEKGVISPEQAAAMSETDAQRLVFAPGFSTAQAVTDISGRGMGMDIVESSIKKLRGSLELSSTLGRGSTFTIQLPPSMSILSSLLVSVGGTTFSLPLTEVREIVELAGASVHSVQGRRMIVVRERPMPLVSLPATYRFSNTNAKKGSSSPEHAVVFGYPGNEIALTVDRLLGKEDLVIKPLCAELAAVRGLAGMAIRGDGEVTLIVDPVSFADYAMVRHQVAPAV